MRLINCSSLKIKYFVSDYDIPPYAILSHTWGEEEVSLQDWQQDPSSSQMRGREGYKKIQLCCQQAIKDGLEWAWVDTCCIDKTSSAELSESINSMFRWYQNASLCYSYLSDVPKTADASALDSDFAKSRWFTRGWTLQELIAPKELRFYSVDWHMLGTKAALTQAIHSITGIQAMFLTGADLRLASAAKKMYWAAKRKTSRIEDIAYCLLGIFDINMPLIYGEGQKSFYRLQEEIIKATPDDHSIFCWGTAVDTCSFEITDQDQVWGVKPLEHHNATSHSLLGLFATSPQDFASSGHYIPSSYSDHMIWNPARETTLPTMLGKGIRLSLPVIPGEFHSIYAWKRPAMGQIRTGQIAVLSCCHEEDPELLVCIPLQRWGRFYRGRTKEILLKSLQHAWAKDIYHREGYLRNWTLVLNIVPEIPAELEGGDVIIRRLIADSGHNCQGWVAGPGIHYLYETRVFKVKNGYCGDIFAYFFMLTAEENNYGFYIRMKRFAPDALGTGQTIFAVVPVIEDLTSLTAPKHEQVHWYGREDFWSADPPYTKHMATPSDVWTLDLRPFPRISVIVEQKKLSETDDWIDIVDITVSNINNR